MEGNTSLSAGACAAAAGNHPAGAVSQVSSSCAAPHAHSSKGVLHPSRLRRMSTPASKPDQHAEGLAMLIADSACSSTHMEEMGDMNSAEQPHQSYKSGEQQQIANMQDTPYSRACCTDISSSMQCQNPVCAHVAAVVATADMAAADSTGAAQPVPFFAEHDWSTAGSTNRHVSSRDYAAALAAAQQLPWPPSWHWPHKMAYANAAGVRYIDLQEPNRSSSMCRGDAGVVGARQRTPSATFAGGSGSSSVAGCRSTSGRGSAPGSADQQLKQWRPSEVLSAIHAHLAASPAVSAAVTAAGAASSSSAADDAAAAAAVQSCLQQQFAEAFAGWDVDNDGVLNATELRGMLAQVLPPGTVHKEEARYCQVLLDRLGCGVVGAPDLLAAAHTAVQYHAGICPKPRADVNDVLLQLVLQLKQDAYEQQQYRRVQKHKHSVVSLAHSLFRSLDEHGTGRLGAVEIGRLFKQALPGLHQRDITFMSAHMSELDPEGSGHVTLKQLLAAIQPVQQTLEALQQPGGTAAVEASWRCEAVQASQPPQQQQLEAGMLASSGLSTAYNAAAAAAPGAEGHGQQQQPGLPAAPASKACRMQCQASVDAAAAHEVLQQHDSIDAAPAAYSAPPSPVWEASGGGSRTGSRGSSRSMSASSSCSNLGLQPVSRRRWSIANSDDSFTMAGSPLGPLTPAYLGQQQQEGQQEGQQWLQDSLLQLRVDEHARHLLQHLPLDESQHAPGSTDAGSAAHQLACTQGNAAAIAAGAAAADPAAAWQLPPAPAPVRVQSAPRLNSSSNGTAAGSMQRGSSGGVKGDCVDLVLPVLWPMQELAAVLASNPVAMQLAFMQTAAACSSCKPAEQQQPCQPCIDQDGSCSGRSPQLLQQLPSQQQQRYSLVPIAALPQLLAAAMTGWGGADVSYAALQIRCHMNIIANFSIDTPTAAASRGSRSGAPFSNCGSQAAAISSSGEASITAAAAASDAPTDMMYAELAATIVSAAATEAAAAAGELPAAVQQLVVDLADEVTSNAEAYARLERAWQQAAAASAGAARASTAAAAAAAAGQALKLPVVAGVRLLCKQLVTSLGLSDIRLLGWLTCLVRQQHLALQLAALQEGSSTSNSAAADCIEGAAEARGSIDLQLQQQQEQGHAGVLIAEVCLQELCEVLAQLVQCLLTADDAALVEEFKQPAHDGSPDMYGQHISWLAEGAAARAGGDRGWTAAGMAANQAQPAAAAGAWTPELAAPARRQRIVFCGASSRSSSACSSPCWRAFAQQHRGSCGEYQQQQQQQVFDGEYFQPVHCGAGSAADSLLGSPYHPDGKVASAGFGRAVFADGFGKGCDNGVDHGLGNASVHSVEGASGGGCLGSTVEGAAAAGGGVSLVPVGLQLQRQQLQRLRAAQQRAWHAEMLLQHQPWEGAYSPVAAGGGCGSSNSSFFRVTAESAGADGAVDGAAVDKPGVVDILRLSSTDYRSSCSSNFEW